MSFPRQAIEQSLAARFEEQARLNAHRPAVRSRSEALTYAALNQCANRVARAILARRGAGSEPIALLLPHDAPLIAAILGVLKAGKAYVPLDPSFPPARNASILEDSQAALIVTDARNAALAREWSGGSGELLEIEAALSHPGTDNLQLSIAPDAMASILYTSGSTGQPKGVVQIQRNVLHNVLKYTNAARLDANDRLSLLSSCSFGASVSDLFGALLNGASLHLFDLRQEGLAPLADWLTQEAITVYHSVPTVFRHFTDLLAGDVPFPDLRLIKLGGEPVLRADVERYRRHFSRDCVLYVGLGCTEMSIVRCWLVDRETPLSGSTAPVGYPVEDTRVLLLNEAGQPVGPDEVGEIAIQSRYLSPGYWRRPELTAERFRPLPDSEERLYLTGDMGRLLPDGCLVHLGRKDDQVKIRGFRVELAEVELALLEHAGVREAVVAPLEREDGDRYLAAYLVAHSDPAPSVDELRRLLRRSLPEPMVPAAFQFLTALPTTPTGKVDRRALPAPGPSGGVLRPDYLPPRDGLERRLTRIWEAVLGTRPVGVRDSFFDRGGDSLLAARLFAVMEKELKQRLPLAALLEAPTVEGLAALLRQPGQSAPWPALVPIRAPGSRPPLFCVHGVGGNILEYRDLARYLDPEQPVYALQSLGLDERATGPTRVEDMAARYLQAVRGVQPEGPYLLCGASFGGRVAFEMAQQLHAQGAEIGLLAVFDTAGRSSARTWTLRQRIRAQVGLLKEMPSRQRLGHLLTRARVKTRKEWSLLTRRALLRLGCPLPRALSRVALINRHASREYLPQAYAGRVTLFRARERRDGEDDAALGWAPLAAGGLELIEVPGNHVTMLREPNTAVLAEQLGRCLDRTRD